MAMEVDLITRLVAVPAIAAIIGTRAAWMERAGDGIAPAIRLTLAASGRSYTHGGWDGVDGPTVQFDYLGGDTMELLSLRAAVRMAMESPSPVAGEVVGATRFFPAEVVAARTLEPDDLGDQLRQFGFSDDFQFYHEAA